MPTAIPTSSPMRGLFTSFANILRGMFVFLLLSSRCLRSEHRSCVTYGICKYGCRSPDQGVASRTQRTPKSVHTPVPRSAPRAVYVDSWPSIYTTQILYSANTIFLILLVKKNPHSSGSSAFKLVLFRGQLYFLPG